jgi:hypothetical protein
VIMPMRLCTSASASGCNRSTSSESTQRICNRLRSARSPLAMCSRAALRCGWGCGHAHVRVVHEPPLGRVSWDGAVTGTRLASSRALAGRASLDAAAPSREHMRVAPRRRQAMPGTPGLPSGPGSSASGVLVC